MGEQNYKCVYCTTWNISPIKKDMSESGKKTSKIIKRKCVTLKRFVTSDSDACEYFAPSATVHCDLTHTRMNLVNCLQRRRNPKQFKSWHKCRKCRQFDQELLPIIEDYYLNNKEILVPKEKRLGRKIKRRKDHPKKRIIKRRKKSNLEKGLDALLPKKRKIKRRKKKRTIKRR